MSVFRLLLGRMRPFPKSNVSPVKEERTMICSILSNNASQDSGTMITSRELSIPQLSIQLIRDRQADWWY